jgi:hypothetical protein
MNCALKTAQEHRTTGQAQKFTSLSFRKSSCVDQPVVQNWHNAMKLIAAAEEKDKNKNGAQEKNKPPSWRPDNSDTPITSHFGLRMFTHANNPFNYCY